MPKALFSRLSAVMNEVRKLQDEKALMSVQTLEVFLTVAAKEGMSSSDIRKLTGIPQPSISRALGDLGDKAVRKGTEGLKLVRVERDPNDLRNTLCYLSPTGKLLAARMAQLMGVDDTKVDGSFVNGAQ
ncbi:DNA-binding transcriptional regulator, MarR family [Rhizobium mongolense subsp. loessense]|uniref:DNA-binding transcriptional regulator, MarR family n=1 Tax=Rhizobium mongolense subsp. loessense TaxID=158890 RepID=A0A1G4T6A2_9HYPH|nr:MarR family winged helix-turn-helix transcriptional regulator [Rhizobium mongolense]SCW76938.1 DNA-binding transcriptional regulator, MarR family [Rhizobium mongolense subsp. loessense]